jgi:hypothetical protein
LAEAEAHLSEPIQAASVRGESRPSDIDWLIALAGTALVEVALCFVLASRGYASPPLIKVYGVFGYTILAVAGAGLLLWRLFQMARQGEPQPIERTMGMIRANATTIMAAIVAVQIFSVGSAAFSALKTALPSVSPFWADLYLAPFEARLFGEPPWELTHQLFGWATPAIDFVYASWLGVQIAAFYSLLALKPSQLKTQALKSHAFAWLILGVGGAYALSSAGPIYYDRVFGGVAFSGLAQTLQSAPVATRTSEMLWRAYAQHTNEIASGISAMPSMHVAMTCWLALTIRRGLRRMQWLGWTYLALIWLGSVHLGWHYVFDGAVGIVGMLAIWRLAGAVPSFVERRAQVSIQAVNP